MYRYYNKISDVYFYDISMMMFFYDKKYSKLF